MKVKKVKSCLCMNDCYHTGEGYVITYNDDESLIFLCEKCLDDLTRKLNNNAADRWLEEETGC